ncbi:hypothetical protein BH10ACT1_BH10ACT1_34060 [soil metagenome]
MALATPPSLTDPSSMLSEVALVVDETPWELRLWAQADGDRPDIYGPLVKEAATICTDLELLVGRTTPRPDLRLLALELDDYLVRVLMVRVPLEAAIDRPDPTLWLWLETVARPATLHLEKLTHALHRTAAQLGN